MQNTHSTHVCNIQLIVYKCFRTWQDSFPQRHIEGCTWRIAVHTWISGRNRGQAPGLGDLFTFNTKVINNYRSKLLLGPVRTVIISKAKLHIWNVFYRI